MPTRRAHAPRNTRLPVHTTVPRYLNSHTFTLIASWRGQLLICSVVLVVGAVYFVVREPIRQWRRRQRERLSRALTAELLSMEKREPAGPSEENERPSSQASSTALPIIKTARERGREKRKGAKEAKKRNNLLRTNSNISAADTAQTTTSSMNSITSSPVLASVTSAESLDASELQTLKEESLNGTDRSNPVPSTDTIAETAPSPSSPAPPLPKPQSPSIQQPLAGPSRIPFSPLEVDISTDGEDHSDFPGQSRDGRPSFTREPSSSFSIIPDESYLPLLPSAGKKKHKRKSKARSGGDAPRTPDLSRPPPAPLSAVRSMTMSSDDTSSPRSLSMSSIPGSPTTPRRRRKGSVGGMPMTPALDMLLTNHERTIDSLRAEIGHAKAEEGKARDAEAKARDEVRRSRATEDRMRSDYERARKARDRAESDTKRVEAELLLMRNRFETLSHMYNAVCNRLRDIEMVRGHDGLPQIVTQMPHSPQLSSPYMAFPSPNGVPMGFMPYGNGAMYGSPVTPHGFAMHPMSPSPLRRTEGSGSSDLAGPLTPGIGPLATPSQLSSPYPSEMAVGVTTPPPSASVNGESQMSAIELRRLHIASSVLKKKATTSESGDSVPNSAKASESTTESSKASEIGVAGLGITQLNGVPSTFPSVNGTKPTKQNSVSSSSSNASSAAPGRHILITPSNADLYQPTEQPSSKGSEPLVQEPDAVDSAQSDVTNGQCDLQPKTECKRTIDDANKFSETNDTNDAEFVPMFASLAHTPEQRAELARIRENAIRDRERRSRTLTVNANDT